MSIQHRYSTDACDVLGLYFPELETLGCGQPIDVSNENVLGKGQRNLEKSVQAEWPYRSTACHTTVRAASFGVRDGHVDLEPLADDAQQIPAHQHLAGPKRAQAVDRPAGRISHSIKCVTNGVSAEIWEATVVGDVVPVGLAPLFDQVSNDALCRPTRRRYESKRRGNTDVTLEPSDVVKCIELPSGVDVVSQ